MLALLVLLVLLLPLLLLLLMLLLFLLLVEAVVDIWAEHVCFVDEKDCFWPRLLSSCKTCAYWAYPALGRSP